MTEKKTSFIERLTRNVNERGETKLYFLKEMEGKTEWPKEGIAIRDLRHDHDGHVSYTLFSGPGSKEVHPVPTQAYDLATELHQELISSETRQLGYRLVRMEYSSMAAMPREKIKQHYDVMLNFIEHDIHRARELQKETFSSYDVGVLEEAYQLLSTCFDGRDIDTVSIPEIEEKLGAALKYFDKKHEETFKTHMPLPGKHFHPIPNTWEMIANSRLGNRFPFLRTW